MFNAIKDAGGSATGFHSDARDEDQVIELFDRVERDIGPIDVCVFNVGGNVRFSITETTARVYRKVWEMCAFAAFLVGREAAKRMLERGRGTILVHRRFGQCPGPRRLCRILRRQACKARPGPEHGPRARPQRHPRGPRVIDGAIDTKWTREIFPDWFETRPEDGIMQPEDIAEIYWNLHAAAAQGLDV